MSQIPHIQFQWGAFLPLLAALPPALPGRTADGATSLLFGVCLAWNALANVHYAFFSAALVAIVLAFEAVWKGAPARGRIGAALLAGTLAAGAVFPFFVPYSIASRMYGLKRSEHETEWFSGRLTEFLSAGVRNKLYGPVTQRFSHPEGDFFPGLVPLALAAAAAGRRRRPAAETGPETSGRAERSERRKGRAVRALDAGALALAALWGAAIFRPGLHIGGVKLSDPGRLVVFATALFVARLVLAFPRRLRYGNLGDFLRRGPLDPGVARFLAIGLAGVVIALGLHSPYYRFFFQSFGFLFGAIRAPSRGIVLFQLALAVLSAWGLSRVARRGTAIRRAGLLAGALAATAFEYRAFPIGVSPVESRPAAVYPWLAGVGLEGRGVLEWPIGDWYDFEYEFRSTAHWKPLLNGYSGFGPPSYHRLRGLFAQVPIPAEAWNEAVRLGAAIVVLHPHDAAPAVLGAYAAEIRRRASNGDAELLRAFPHGADTDYVFRVRGTRLRGDLASTEERLEAQRRFEELRLRPGLDPSPPLVALDSPPASVEVSPGEWAWGWALDDSGIAEILVSTDAGPAGAAVYGGARPDVARAYPHVPGSASPAFQFRIPPLAPGPHTLTVTVRSKDGGGSVLRRSVRVRSTL